MIIAYLWDYSLNVLCKGNKSELAREMGFRRPDINRMLKRLKEGATSMRATEAVLEFLYKKQCSLDNLLSGYVYHNSNSCESLQLACEDLVRNLHKQLSNNYCIAKKKVRILQSAEVFMGQLEFAFCSNYCRIRGKCEKDCPCMRFAEFVEWMQEKLEVDVKAPAM